MSDLVVEALLYRMAVDQDPVNLVFNLANMQKGGTGVTMTATLYRMAVYQDHVN